MSKINYKTEFLAEYKTGDKIKVGFPRYNDKVSFHTIGRTDLKDSFGQVELLTNKGEVKWIVEYQWFDEELTDRKVIKL
jgi:hypothetical protein